MADSDGKVPIKDECEARYDSDHNPIADATLAWVDGYYVTSPTGEVLNVDLAIHVDRCKIKRYGGGKLDAEKILRHEKAHAKGWDHYEEPR